MSALITPAGYQGDISVGDVLSFIFNSHKATGEPISMGGTSSVSVYKNGSATEYGLTGVLTADFDAKTGLNLIAINTATEFLVAGDYSVVLSNTPTVDGVSVANTRIGSFSISSREGTAAAVAAAFIGSVNVTSPVLEDGTIEVVRGGDYTGTRSLELVYDSYVGPSLSGGTAYLKAMPTASYNADDGTADISKTGTVSVNGSTITLTFTLDAADTASLTIVPEEDGQLNYTYEAWVVTTGNKVIPLALGAMTIKRDVA